MLHTSWKHWALTLGSAAVVTMFIVGYGQLVLDAGAVAVDVAWWLVRPIGEHG
jgi:hypothetical protein